jgi:hypothetical protein
LLKTYDFVSLLIGVNNQYRGYSQKEYSIDFESLLKDALKFAANNKNRIVVLSIPDWGATPFAKDRNRKLISNEIDDYNKINETITQKMGIQYIYITDWTREAATDLSLLTTDGLHPSGKEYKRWAEKWLIIFYFRSIQNKKNRFGFLVKYDLKNHQKFGFPKNSLILPRKAKTLYRTCSRLKSGFILSDLTHYGKKFIDSRARQKQKP